MAARLLPVAVQICQEALPSHRALIGCRSPERWRQPKAADARPRLSGKTAEMNNRDGITVTVGSHARSAEIFSSM